MVPPHHCIPGTRFLVDAFREYNKSISASSASGSSAGTAAATAPRVAMTRTASTKSDNAQSMPPAALATASESPSSSTSSSMTGIEVDGIELDDGIAAMEPHSHSGPLFFLSHFHADHYAGLTKTWRAGPVFCSPTTARLVIKVLEVDERMIRPLEFNTPVTIDNVQVTLMDANHCPGAAMMLFKVSNGLVYLHTGDFRYHPRMNDYPALIQAQNQIETLFLDTTYCNPKYTLPAQDAPIDFVAETVFNMMRSELQPAGDNAALPPAPKRVKLSVDDDDAAAHESQRLASDGDFSRVKTLFLIASYVIGKERLYVEVSRRCGCKIVVDERKHAVLALQEGIDMSMFSLDWRDSPVHVVPWGFLGEMAPGGWRFNANHSLLTKMLAHYAPRFDRLVAFLPTGWTYTFKYATTSAKGVKYSLEQRDNIQVYSIPYSEHSSFTELRQFVSFLHPKRIVPTVVGRDAPASKAEKLNGYFADLVDVKSRRADFLALFGNGSVAAADSVGARKRSVQHDDATTVLSIDDDSDENSSDEPGIAIQPDDKSKVSCPICSTTMASSEINEHLDSCLNSTSRPPSDSAQFRPTTSAITASGNTASGSSVNLHIPRTAAALNNHDSADDAREASLSQLAAMLPPGTSRARLQRLLILTSGNVQRAVNQYFDESSRSGIALSSSSAASASASPETDKSSPMKARQVGIAAAFLAQSTLTRSAHAHSSSSASSPSRSLDTRPVRLDMLDDEKLPARPNESSSSQTLISATAAVPVSQRASLEVGAQTPFLTLARTYSSVEANTGRLTITALLTDMFRSIIDAAPQDLLPAVYLTTNRTSPSYEPGDEMSIGGHTMVSAVSEVTGMSLKQIKHEYETLGDLGDIAQKARASMRVLVAPKPLTVSTVFRTMRQIAEIKGHGSLLQKKNLIKRLLVCTREEEMRYLVRIFLQHLRIGAVNNTVLVALAHASETRTSPLEVPIQTVLESLARTSAPGLRLEGLHGLVSSLQPTADRSDKDRLAAAAAVLKQCYNQAPNWEIILRALLKGGVALVAQTCRLQPGIPLKPMLGKICKDLANVIAELDGRDFAADFKYDGQRVQAHVWHPRQPSNGPPRVRLFSRHLEDMTGRFPDVVELLIGMLSASVAEGLPGDSSRIESFILDAEIVAFQRSTGKVLPFQTLSTRARRDVTTNELEVEVCIFAFDLMFLNGQSLLRAPFRHRNMLLRTTFAERPGFFQFVPQMLFGPNLQPALATPATVTRSLPDEAAGMSFSEDTRDQLMAFLHDAINATCEGLMIKPLGARGTFTADDADTVAHIGVTTSDAGDAAAQSDDDDDDDDDHEEESENAGRKGRTGDAEEPVSDQTSVPNHRLRERNPARAASQQHRLEALRQSTYEPSKRCSNWLKVKRDYVEGMVESLDLVPIGAFWGNGRKAGWFSPFLLAAYDPETEQYISVCKCMSGFSDEFYKQQLAFYTQTPSHKPEEGDAAEGKESTAGPSTALGPRIIPKAKPYYVVSPQLQPDVWFEPCQVWEIRGADLTLSPVYTAAAGLIEEQPDRGISLRFPRFLRVRTDKSTEDATTPSELADMFRRFRR
ncbi:ATP dependent DNA ligase [Capsaspora owczarzaki ATCC 30864]|nr:ATP dependent DNA ligase [Capsaspora owczarzaki ATCC 30864]|eukprot:XP_004364857.2 ATP dependent DNA ligase [Capsaspora owczarzaki ATCC 30864]